MMQYDGDLHIPRNFLVSPPAISRTISGYLCAAGVTSFAISETQKYGHVTVLLERESFRLCQRSAGDLRGNPVRQGEIRHRSENEALEITEKAIELLRSGKFRFGRINFPNGDMVGHTGVPEAIITAVKTVDECLGRLIEEVKMEKGIVVVTADHGNADEMFTVKKGVKTVSTAHSLNPVPFAIIDPANAGDYQMAKVEKPGGQTSLPRCLTCSAIRRRKTMRPR